jgi:hypothetical protein
MKKFILSVCVIAFTFSSGHAQKKWKPFAGVHISASNDLYYTGPSFSGGVMHDLGKKKKWSWAPEVHYFREANTYPGNGIMSESDKFLSFSIRSNFNYRIGKNETRGFFIGGGIGFQKAKDECVTIVQNGTIKEENVHFDSINFGAVMMTFNAGYTFPFLKKNSLQAIFSVIGPQTAKDGLGTYVEGISLMNTGIRVVL